MSKRKLLLADDSITIQKVVNLTFADEGIEVISVGDGDSAMQKIVESAPDLVLADVNMPGMNGYQICENLKQNAATQKIPVILLVGSFEPFDEAEAYRVGADDYLTKPFQSIRQLVSKVSDLLEAANGTQAGFAQSALPEEIAAESSMAAGASAEQGNATDFYSADSYSIDANDYSNASVSDYANENIPKVVNLDGAEMDDEMIQTAQIGSLPVDETQKFVVDPQTNESGATEPYQPVYTDFEPQFNLIEEAPPQNEPRKTQLSSDEIFQLFSEDSDEESNKGTSKATIFDFASETVDVKTNVVEKRESPANKSFDATDVSGQKAGQSDVRNFSSDSEIIFDDFPPAQTSSEISFEDMDLLELPTAKSSAGTAPATHRTAKSGERNIGATEKTGKTSERVNQFSRLSPETIEAIAQKVAEKISDKAIREIAWELVPQLTAALIKKMEQEKPKE